MQWTDGIRRYAAQYNFDLSRSQINIGLGVSALALLAGLRYVSSSSSNVYHGPGPKGVPILGNAADLPKKDDYKVYASWREKYGELKTFSMLLMSSKTGLGEIIYLNVLGQPIYILNSFRTASELMNKRAMIYSDRPIMVMVQELVGWKRTPVLTSSDDVRYSRYRKLFHVALRKERVREMAPLQERSTRQMLQLFLDKPEDFVKHIR